MKYFFPGPGMQGRQSGKQRQLLHGVFNVTVTESVTIAALKIPPLGAAGQLSESTVCVTGLSEQIRLGFINETGLRVL